MKNIISKSRARRAAAVGAAAALSALSISAGKGKADALFSGKTWRICGKSHDGQTFEAFGAMPGRGRDYR